MTKDAALRELQKGHTIDIRIYYEDTDAGGIVYHANYLRFAERGRTEFLRALGYTNGELAKDKNIIFVVRHIEINYHKPAVLDDLLRQYTSLRESRNSSFLMKQVFFNYNNPQAPELICEVDVTLVCVDSSTIRPVKIPTEVLQALKDTTH